MKKELAEIKQELVDINLNLGIMREDVNHHIKRSDLHEAEIVHFRTFRERLVGALQFLAFISTLATIYAIFQ